MIARLCEWDNMDRKDYNVMRAIAWDYLANIYQTDNLSRATYDLEQKIRPYIIGYIYDKEVLSEIDTLVKDLERLMVLSAKYYTPQEVNKMGKAAQNEFGDALHDFRATILRIGYLVRE